VARPDNAADTIDPSSPKAGRGRDSFAAFGQALPAGCRIIMPTTERNRLSRSMGPKSAISAGLLDRYRHVVYADLDVGWLADPLWYLDAVAKFYPLAFQTEALRRFRRAVLGIFLAAKSSNARSGLFDAMLSTMTRVRPAARGRRTEDAGCDDHDKPGLLGHVSCCPKDVGRSTDRLPESPERTGSSYTAARQDRAVCVPRNWPSGWRASAN